MPYFRHKLSLQLQICIKIKMTYLPSPQKQVQICPFENSLSTSPQIMHHSLAIIVWQLFYTKISFIGFVPDDNFIFSLFQFLVIQKDKWHCRRLRLRLLNEWLTTQLPKSQNWKQQSAVAKTGGSIIYRFFAVLR